MTSKSGSDPSATAPESSASKFSVFTPEPGSHRKRNNLSHGVSVSWDGLWYSVKVKKKWKALVKDSCGTAQRGRVLAIMGPSGAGKTTLLNTIAGRIVLNSKSKVDGVVYLNSTVLHSKYKPMLSFVSQDDIVMGKDTPREALYFSYRIVHGGSARKAMERVNAMLEKLGLTQCANTVIGIPGLIKGISGGEKKRTNIGTELIHDPQILILDEPTTGLDSVTALRVGKLMHELAQEDRTIITTLHSPSSELFDLLTDLLLLSKGHTVYHGPREKALDYFAMAGYPAPPLVNPAEHYMKVLQADDAEIERLAMLWREIVMGNSELSIAVRNSAHAQVPETLELKNAEFDQYVSDSGAPLPIMFSLLLRRSWRQVYRDKLATIGRCVQAFAFALILGFLYFNMSHDDSGVQDRQGLFFMIIVNMAFSTILSYITTFPPERAVFLADMTKGLYNPVLYFMSKIVADLPLAIGVPVGYMTVIYFLSRMVIDAGVFFGTLVAFLAYANVAGSIGVLLSTLFAHVSISLVVTPLILLPFMTVSGPLANTNRLDPYWLWLNYISFVRAGFIAVSTQQFNALGTLKGPRFQNGKEVNEFNGMTGDIDHWYWQVCILVFMYIVFISCGAISLALQARWQHGKLVFEKNARNIHANVVTSPKESPSEVSLNNKSDA